MTLVGDDCYFFLNNGCIRGNQCSFRHQPGAKNNDVCPEWIQGTCIKPTCVMRHHMIDANRGKVPCYWEQQPNGCLKSNCQFLHLKSGETALAAIPTPPQPVHIVVPKSASLITDQKETSVLNSVNSPVMSNGSILTHNLTNTLNPIPNGVTVPPLTNQLQPIMNPQVVVPHQPRMVLPPFRPQALPLQQVPTHKPVLGSAVQNNIFPKNEHFTKQVALFKKMLAAKKNTAGSEVKQYEIHEENDIEFDDEEFDQQEQIRSRRSRERQRAKKKKVKEVQRIKKHTRKGKDNLSKADEEILYGDYKEIPLDSKARKKATEKTSSNSDGDVNVKSYEEILREKALRKLIEKRKEKFNNDFDQLVSERDKSKFKKHSALKLNHSVKSKEKKTSKNQYVNNIKEISSDVEVYSAEDAIELEVNTSPIRDELKPSTKKEKKSKKLKTSKSKVAKIEHVKINSPPEVAEVVEAAQNYINEGTKLNDGEEEVDQAEKEEVFEIVSDDADVINFSVDDTDELAKELKQSDEKTSSYFPRKSRIHKKVMSSVVVPKTAAAQEKLPKEVTTKTNHKNMIPVNTRTVVEKTIEHSPTKKTSIDNSNEIKIKSFEEIMEEKQRRKKLNGQKVLHDTNDKKTASKNVIATKVNETASEKLKVNIKNSPHPTSNKSANVVVPPITLKGEVKPNNQTNRTHKRMNSNENEDDKHKRKSLQLYKPPSKPDELQEIKEVKTVVNTGSRKIIRIQKSISYPSENSTEDEKEKTVTGVNGSCDKTGGVKSFDEIMREKRLRKKQVEATQRTLNTKKDSAELIVSRAHRFIKNKIVATKVRPTIRLPVTSLSTNTVSSISFAKNNVSIDKVPNKNGSYKVSVSVASSRILNTENNIEQSVLEEPQIKKKKISLSTSSQGKLDNEIEEKTSHTLATSTSAMDDIKEALIESKRQREEDLLSDDEFEKEINDLCAEDDDETENLLLDDDINDDDLLMEIEEMIGS